MQQDLHNGSGMSIQELLTELCCLTELDVSTSFLDVWPWAYLGSLAEAAKRGAAVWVQLECRQMMMLVAGTSKVHGIEGGMMPGA